MIPKVLKRRSSWPSSLVTGLIGWNAFAIITPLGLGYAGAATDLLTLASIAAFGQVVLLRLGFGPLRMARAVWVGAVWGTVTAVVIVAAEMAIFPLARSHWLVALLIGVYVGPAVGAFLSYFHRDDRRIEAAAQGRDVDYGRDAHWLDPFLYGAVAYLVAFVPRTLELAIISAVVGSFVGVAAAGVSHFFLSRSGNAAWTIPVAGATGAAIGAASGFLFRNHQSLLLLRWPLAGAIAGALTFALTAAVGRLLARRERIAEIERPA